MNVAAILDFFSFNILVGIVYWWSITLQQINHISLASIFSGIIIVAINIINNTDVSDLKVKIHYIFFLIQILQKP